MLEKLLSGIWFLKRPDHWAHGWELTMRKFRQNKTGPIMPGGRMNGRRSEACRRPGACGRSLAAPGDLVPEMPASLLDEGQRLGIR